MVAGKVVLEAAERKELEHRVRATTIAVRDRQRAEIILLRAEGMTQRQIAARLGVSRVTVNDWCQRFLARRLAGLDDAPGRGRKPWLPPEAVRMVLEKAVTPPATLARWSCRTMAREAGISQASVQRVWAANDIKPHLARTFKLSKDKQFETKFWDVIGLYLDPPEKALVLCCDEKSQCQALERTQPGLPLGVGQITTRTHDLYLPRLDRTDGVGCLNRLVVTHGHAAMSFSFASGSTSRKVCVRCLAEAPAVLMGPVLVVLGDPSIKIGVQLVDRAIDLFAEGDPIELVQDGAMEALADAIIRHDDFGALGVRRFLGETVYGEPIWDTGRREHKGAGRPPTDPGLRARARYMAAPATCPDAL
jgi:transposase